jgi:serine/threonine protein phosphatase PrpC
MKLTMRVTSANQGLLGQDATKILDAHGCTIGRAAENDWILPDPDRFVSSNHASIGYHDAGFFVTDVSMNGTYLNYGAEPIGWGNSCELRDGDCLSIGNYEIAVSIDRGEQGVSFLGPAVAETADSVSDGRNLPTNSAAAFGFRWHSCVHSDAGLVRAANEDAFLDLVHEGLWIVADGMGGYTLGELASSTVVDSCRSVEAPSSLAQYSDLVSQRLGGANQFLREEAVRRDVQTIGSTVVALMLAEGSFCCLWAGDSRLYRYRDDVLEQLTRDHSLLDELIRAGVVPADTTRHPAEGIITRSVGGDSELQLASINGALRDRDVFLLCSDGLYKELEDAAIVAVVRDAPPAQTCDWLIDQALARGARDNVTVLVVSVEAAIDA